MQMRYEQKNMAGAYSEKVRCPKCGVKLADALNNASQKTFNYWGYRESF